MKIKNQLKQFAKNAKNAAKFCLLPAMLVVAFAIQGCTIGRTIHINSADNNVTFEEETRFLKSKD